MVKATACVLALEDLLQQVEIGFSLKHVDIGVNFGLKLTDDNHPGQRVFVHIGQLTSGQLAPDILDILGFVNIELQVWNVLLFLPTPSSEPVGQCQCAKNGACNTPFVRLVVHYVIVIKLYCTVTTTQFRRLFYLRRSTCLISKNQPALPVVVSSSVLPKTRIMHCLPSLSISKLACFSLPVTRIVMYSFVE